MLSECSDRAAPGHKPKGAHLAAWRQRSVRFWTASRARMACMRGHSVRDAVTAGPRRTFFIGDLYTQRSCAAGLNVARGKSSERLPKEPLRCCPGEGIRRGGCFCHASRASITSAAPTTLTQPTHDLAAGAADPARTQCSRSLVEHDLESKGFRHGLGKKPLMVRVCRRFRTVTAVLQGAIRRYAGPISALPSAEQAGYSSVIVTDVMATGESGRSRLFRGALTILSTTSMPFVTWPKIT
jgi:hypothetical protein